MLTDRAARALNRGTTSGVTGLVVAGFSMSYDALHSLALTQGVPAALAWLWPLVVDGFMASLSVVRAIADGRRATYPWTLVLAFSGISVAFNVVHAAPTMVARFVAAIPPAALVLSFELLMRQLRGALRETCGPAPVSAPHLVLALTANASEPPRQLPTTGRGSAVLERARDICAAHREVNKRLTGTVLARELGISDGYGRRLFVG